MSTVSKTQIVLNINTLLTAAILSLSAWTLREVYNHSTALATYSARLEQATKELATLNARVTELERGGRPSTATK